MKIDQAERGPRHFLIVLLLSLFSFAVFFPTDAFAATAHLKESAPKFIDKTQSMYGEIVNKVALLHDVDQKLITAVIVVESEGNTRVVSRRGAQGLMQLMPKTAKAMGAKNPKDPFQNIMAGTKYLKELQDEHGFDSVGEVLVAYNMGPNGAKRWLQTHSPDEYAYVENVMYVYHMLDKDEQTDVRLAKSLAKRLASEEVFFGLRPVLTRPRSLAMATFPMMIPPVRKDKAELEN